MLAWLQLFRERGWTPIDASTYAAGLGLPANPEHWSDTEVIRALLAHGQDAVGNVYGIDDINGTTPNTGEVYLLQLRPAACVAGNFDLNGDGQVDVLDIQLAAGDWQRPARPREGAGRVRPRRGAPARDQPDGGRGHLCGESGDGGVYG